ncbi:MAG: Abortive infection protein [Candidatus Eremiobacteraeota bacterium]|nr:Abortive infection protein [Candidatus Eremiobacteraeota bacterium]
MLFVANVVPAMFFLALLLMFRIATLQDLKSFSWPMLAAQFASYACQLAVLVPLLPAVAHRSLRDLGLRIPTARDLLWAIGGAVAMVLAATAVAAFQESFLHVKADEVQVQMLRKASGSVLAGLVFLACVAAPFFEELTFRGFIFNAFLRYMPWWAAALVSGIIFGGVHWLPGNNGAILPLAAGGVVLAVVYYRSGSLVSSMITHALFNTFTVVLVVVFHQM